MALKSDLQRMLVLSVVILTVVGIVMVYSASCVMAVKKYGDASYFLKKHLVYTLLGIVALVVMAKARYQVLAKAVYPLLIVNFILLLCVWIPGIGRGAYGAQRWLDLGVFTVQPAELAKLTILLFLARSFTLHEEKMNTFGVGFIPHVLVPACFICVIAVQPDVGTALNLGLIVLLMLYMARARVTHILITLLFVIPPAALYIWSAPYRRVRILAFLDPWAYESGIGFQLTQSFIAFGTGGMTGTGLGEGVRKLFFLPEIHTDFVFSLIGEEFGFIGVVLVVLLFALFIITGVKIALRAEEPFGLFLALGVTIMIGCQAVVNMAVTLGMLPTKGLPLPFLSYGGTALVVNLICVGLLLSISARERRPVGREA